MKALKLGQTKANNIQKLITRIVLKDCQILADRFLTLSIAGRLLRQDFSSSTQTNQEGSHL